MWSSSDEEIGACRHEPVDVQPGEPKAPARIVVEALHNPPVVFSTSPLGQWDTTSPQRKNQVHLTRTIVQSKATNVVQQINPRHPAAGIEPGNASHPRVERDKRSRSPVAQARAARTEKDKPLRQAPPKVHIGSIMLSHPSLFLSGSFLAIVWSTSDLAYFTLPFFRPRR